MSNRRGEGERWSRESTVQPRVVVLTWRRGGWREGKERAELQLIDYHGRGEYSGSTTGTGIRDLRGSREAGQKAEFPFHREAISALTLECKSRPVRRITRMLFNATRSGVTYIYTPRLGTSLHFAKSKNRMLPVRDKSRRAEKR